MALVIVKPYVFHFEIAYIAHVRVNPERRQRKRAARELLSHLVKMIKIDVRVSHGVHEFANSQPGYLSNHCQ